MTEAWAVAFARPIGPNRAVNMDRRELSASERLDWLRLARAENVGPIMFFQLLQACGGPTEALAAIPAMAARGGRRRPIRIPTRQEADREIDAAGRLNGQLITAADAAYPEMLAAIPDPPPVITVLGDQTILKRRNIAVVGARNASANGRRLAQKLAGDLGGNGLCVTSGLARGIDAAAHDGALGTGTIAVVAGGVDVVYPKENQGLYDRIVAQGAVVSECAIRVQPQARHFPRRNRLISGLSEGVCVVEAALRSGSLITARCALEQGRDVFAVPGSPMDPRCRGCNDLIRQGAVLTESVEDILSAGLCLTKSPPVPARPPTHEIAGLANDPDLDSIRRQILQHLGPTPISVDELLRLCQAPPAAVWTILLELELADALIRSPGGQVNLVGEPP